jgi:broad specificity phosphatase PhoE
MNSVDVDPNIPTDHVGHAPRWPARLWIVRHGESSGNIARDRANLAGLDRIDIAQRDVEVPLSERGREQVAALGQWFGALAADQRPEVVIASPYLRAKDTAASVATSDRIGQTEIQRRVDERFREREFGVLDRLTSAGIRQLFPEQVNLRKSIGKFYHRPPGGESWCDVILRLRSALDTMSLHYAGRRVLVVAHQVVVLCLRYLLEDMTEAQILEIDAAGDVANCSITEYALGSGTKQTAALTLVRYNFVGHLERLGAAITDAPDKSSAPR